MLMLPTDRAKEWDRAGKPGHSSHYHSRHTQQLITSVSWRCSPCSLLNSPWGMAWKASFVGANTVKVPGLFRISVRPADWIAATNVLQGKHASNASLQTTPLVSCVLGSRESWEVTTVKSCWGPANQITKMMIREKWACEVQPEHLRNGKATWECWLHGDQMVWGVREVWLQWIWWAQMAPEPDSYGIKEPLTLGSQLTEGYLKFHSL